MNIDIKKSFLVSVVLLLVVSSTIASASAKGWEQSETPPLLPHTAANPGSVNICGDHKCGPFEDGQKPLQDILKQNHSDPISKPNQTKIK
jgi:hypothetical protein